MGIVSDMLDIVEGKVHFYLSVGGKPAVEIIVRNKEKEIVAEIKNPLLAVELGIHQLAGGGKYDSSILKNVKKAGYKIKIKYKMLEFEL